MMDLYKQMILNRYCRGRNCSDCVLNGMNCDEEDERAVEKCFARIEKHDRPFMIMVSERIKPETPLVEGVAEVAKAWDELKSEVLPTTKDPVNHPGHYESGKFECIDVMLETQGKEAVMGFCICNAFKYLYRHNRKNGIEDVKKAQWYIDKFLELAEEEKT